MKQQFFTLKQQDDTLELAKLMAPLFQTGYCLALQGDLGAGKTTFARAFIRAWVGKDDIDVPSPTFTLVQHYEDGKNRLDHYDAYRIEDEDEISEIGLEDSLEKAITLIEWPEKISSYLPSNLYRLILKIADDGKTRQACLVADEKILKALESFTN